MNPERYRDNIRPDQLFKVPIQGGELHISPAHDILHYFSWLDKWMLKYWDSDNDPPRFCDVVMETPSAEWLVTELDLEVCSRTFITASEMERLRDYGARMLEAEFGAELGDIDLGGDGVE